VLKDMISLLHPFMPFITEEIYKQLPNKKDMLIVEDWPQVRDDFNFDDEARVVDGAIEAIKAIRNQRQSLNLGSKTRQDLIIYSSDENTRNFLEILKGQFVNLSKSGEISIISEDKEVEDAVSLIFNDFKIYIPLENLIDYDKERKRLKDEIKKLESEIKRAEGKLNNQGFVSKAPEAVVNEEREKLEKYKDLLVKTQESYKEIEDK
ncbi:MAG: class I tRNA ligase family protein, partial [Anaerococcus vaginalis]|nr:class I tRNA ligase family protein [Anaerococcus vaginalis]